MDKYIGKKLDGRYEIQELIGVGGMANVYKAYDLKETRYVAVKILRDEFLDNDEVIRRFKNESKAIAVLNHPNIVKVYDVSFSGQVQSIVMEYIDGITLKEYIEQQGVLHWKEAVYFTLQILRALQHAHEKGIVHRDIKPHNIMLLSDGVIKVMDFGIARFARSETRTLTDKAIGSVHYISPEQARGEPTDARTDIYSVGVIMFEMLTGRLPFEADSPVSVAIKQIQAQAVRPREINPSIPEGLEEITMRAMQKDPANRYQSAAEMLQDIDEFKNNPSILFQYKYLTADETKSREDIKKASQKAKNKEPLQKIRKPRQKKKRLREQPPNGGAAEKPLPVIPVLTGVTLAFVLATIAFIVVMMYLNNPFKRVNEIIMPNLVGLNYNEVVSSDAYSSFNIKIEQTDYSENYAKGEIYEQKPKFVEGKKIKEGATIKVWVSNGQKIITMPDFTSVEVAAAFAELNNLGLEYSVIKLYSDTIPQDCVISTEPGKNSEVSSGTNVTVYTSMGPKSEVVSVPMITGMDINDAKDLLTAYKLKIGLITQVESDLPSGTVISQSPGEGSMVTAQSVINIEVSADDESLKKLTLLIKLPQSVTEQVHLAAYLDGEQAASTDLVPSESRVWPVTFTGSEESMVSVYLNDELMSEYRIFFNSNTFIMERDDVFLFEVD